ncbi:MAG: PIN domain-containing protein [Thermoproteota archaeon]
MQEESIKVVIDAYIIKGILGVEPYDKVFSVMQEKCHMLVISSELVDKYTEAIKKNHYSSRTLAYPKLEKLYCSEKVSSADKEIEELKEIRVKVEDKDDIPFVKAAVAAKAKYLLTEDQKHLLSKKEEFKREYQIEVLTPEEYIKKFQN